MDGTVVSGLAVALLVYIPGNILQGNWRVGVVVDDKATPQQQEALLNVWTGKLARDHDHSELCIAMFGRAREAAINVGPK